MRKGNRFGGTFHLRHCPSCTFHFVADPVTNYAETYDGKYHVGAGSDPMVNHASEYVHPETTIRKLDWEGIERVITHRRPDGGRWLHYGTNALIRNVARNESWQIASHDTGAWAAKARADGLVVLDADQRAKEKQRFDEITAIEVIDHIADLLAFLARFHTLARAGTLLFLAALNARVAPRNLPRGSYVPPETHVSFLTLQALSLALKKRLPSGISRICPRMGKNHPVQGSQEPRRPLQFRLAYAVAWADPFATRRCPLSGAPPVVGIAN